jgi:serine/threonine-protein kinase
MQLGPQNQLNRDCGRIVGEKYRLLSVLGRGGMGTVWRAEHLQLGATVAVKLIDPDAVGGADAFRLCQREARAAAELRSPHVTQVLDVGRDEASGAPFIVMEHLEGESLADRLSREGRLSLADTSRVVTHVARALSRAHDAGIIHRDLKPANVFLVRNDDEEVAKVLDFGIAHVQRTDTLGGSVATTGAVVGTPQYMSPEHIGAQAVDHRTDLWAMAVMAFECVTGRRPFDATEIGPLVLQICTYPIPVPSEVANVPAAFDTWFARATRRAPDERFQSARELADELRQICLKTTPGSAALAGVQAGRDTVKLPPPTERTPWLPARGRAFRWFGGGALLVAAVAAMAVRSGRVPRAPALPAVTAASAPAAPVPAPLAAVPGAVPSSRAGDPPLIKPSPHSGRKTRARTSAPARPASNPLSVESVLDYRR